MLRIAILSFCTIAGLRAQVHPLRALIDAARTGSPKLKDLLGAKDAYGGGLPELAGRDGAAVWGQEFFFAVESQQDAAVSIDKEPAIPMKRAQGTHYWYLPKMLRLGTTHQYQYYSGGQPIQGAQYQVAGYNPDSYPIPGVPRGTLSEKRTLQSAIYPGMSSNYWIYVNPGVDQAREAPLMVWQDGETIVGNQDLLRLRMQIVSDNLVAKRMIPPMVHVLIQPGTGGKESQRMRSIEYDTVSDRYGKYVLQEVLADVEKKYKM